MHVAQTPTAEQHQAGAPSTKRALLTRLAKTSQQSKKEKTREESDHSSDQSSSEDSNWSSEESDQYSQSSSGDTSTYTYEEENLSVDLDTLTISYAAKTSVTGSLRTYKANCRLSTRNLYTKGNSSPKCHGQDHPSKRLSDRGHMLQYTPHTPCLSSRPGRWESIHITQQEW